MRGVASSKIMCSLKLLLSVSGLLCSSILKEVKAQSHIVNKSDEAVSGCEDFVTYHRGGLSGWPPIVLSAPHGGRLAPSLIPDRDAGCWISDESKCEYTHTCGVKDFTRCRVITENDFNTYKLTLEVRHNLCELFGGMCPAAVFNNLLRTKFDANRNSCEATFNVPKAMCAFLKYQSHIDDAKSVITRYNEVGLFIDIHGHGHRIQRAELGYLQSGTDLNSGEPVLANHTSIRYLAERLSAIDFDTLLRGNVSFGALLKLYGFSAVPSPTYRDPGAGNPYFSGGYLTRKHGSISTGMIDAIQVESARSFRENTVIGRYAKALACALRDYICMYYLPVGEHGRTEPNLGCSERHQNDLCSGHPSPVSHLNTILLWTALLSVSLLSRLHM